MRSHRLALNATFQVIGVCDLGRCCYGNFADLASPGPELRSRTRTAGQPYSPEPFGNDLAHQATTRGRR
jgi:hypothetical protein